MDFVNVLTQNMTKNSKYFLFLGLILLFQIACKVEETKFIPQVSTEGIELQINRFEQSLLKMDTSILEIEKERLAKEYPLFLNEIFLSRIIPVLQDPKIFKQFIQAEQVRGLLDTCATVYSDLSKEKKELEQAFAFYQYYFPNGKIPDIVTFTSEYTLGNFSYEDSLVGIGLDFFLGEDHIGYSPDFFPKYIRNTMSREYMVSKTVKTLVSDLVGSSGKSRLIDIMVNNGKMLYITDLFLPYEADSIKLEYTANQVDWVKNNEQKMWAFFLDEELLYKTNQKDFQKFIGPSPNSPGMPDEAPGRTANYIGLQIVEAYMNRFPETTIQALIDIKDGQEMLTKSKYKPKR